MWRYVWAKIFSIHSFVHSSIKINTILGQILLIHPVDIRRISTFRVPGFENEIRIIYIPLSTNFSWHCFYIVNHSCLVDLLSRSLAARNLPRDLVLSWELCARQLFQVCLSSFHGSITFRLLLEVLSGEESRWRVICYSSKMTSGPYILFVRI